MATTRRVTRTQVSALILAAGSGQRLGGVPKAFLRWKGKTFLQRAADLVTPFASEIIVGVRHEDVTRARRLLSPRVRILAGGSTRQETVSILLGSATRPLVLLLEAARPFTSAESVARVLEAGTRYGAAVTCYPLRPADSPGVSEGEKLVSLIPRDRLVATQIPHAYRRRILVQAHQRAARGGWQCEGTAGLVKRAGFPVHLVFGSTENTKITYREDLALLRGAKARKP